MLNLKTQVIKKVCKTKVLSIHKSLQERQKLFFKAKDPGTFLYYQELPVTHSLSYALFPEPHMSWISLLFPNQPSPLLHGTFSTMKKQFSLFCSPLSCTGIFHSLTCVNQPVVAKSQSEHMKIIPRWTTGLCSLPWLQTQPFWLQQILGCLGVLGFHSDLSGHSVDFSLGYSLPVIDRQLTQHYIAIIRKTDVTNIIFIFFYAVDQ